MRAGDGWSGRSWVAGVADRALSVCSRQPTGLSTSRLLGADVTIQEYFAHETAIVDEGAVIGSGTKIWHWTHVSSGSVIGSKCSLGQNVYVAPNVQLGNGVKVQNNVSVYEGVVLEYYVCCGPSMVFTNVRTPRSAFPRNTAAD